MRLIVESGNDYLVKVKANQPKLLRALEEAASTSRRLDRFAQWGYARGRIEYRRVEVYPAPAAPDWVGLRRVLLVQRWGVREGSADATESYYISSLKRDEAAYLAGGVRGHWLIENRLHWVKDAVQAEDRSGIGSKEAAANLSLLRSMGITFYRRKGHASLKVAAERFANRVKELLHLLRT